MVKLTHNVKTTQIFLMFIISFELFENVLKQCQFQTGWELATCLELVAKQVARAGVTQFEIVEQFQNNGPQHKIAKALNISSSTSSSNIDFLVYPFHTEISPGSLNVLMILYTVDDEKRYLVPQTPTNAGNSSVMQRRRHGNTGPKI